jgi:hypothetical protein
MAAKTAAVASILSLRIVVLHVFQHLGRFDNGLRKRRVLIVALAQVQA